jgi:hypothetical protein
MTCTTDMSILTSEVRKTMNFDNKSSSSKSGRGCGDGRSRMGSRGRMAPSAQ